MNSTATLLLTFLLAACSTSKVTTTNPPTATTTPAPTPSPVVQAPSPTPVATSANSPEGKITCKSDKDERVVEVVKTPTGCDLNYTKFGQTNPIASSALGTRHCENVRDKVKANLEQAGFKCE